MKMILDAIYLGIFGPLEVALIFTVVMVGFAVLMIPLIFYLITLQNTLYEVSPQNRRMPPGQVWLIIIPLFGMVWQFFVVNAIADSLKAEFALRNIRSDEDRPGSGIGIAYCVLNCCSIIPFLGFLASMGALICWILYWVKVHGYKIHLQQIKNR